MHGWCRSSEHFWGRGNPGCPLVIRVFRGIRFGIGRASAGHGVCVSDTVKTAMILLTAREMSRTMGPGLSLESIHFELSRQGGLRHHVQLAVRPVVVTRRAGGAISRVAPNGEPRPWWVGIVCGMASYIDAAAITGFSSALVILAQAGLVDDRGVGIAAGALTLGIAGGAFVGGRLGDRYGRRPVFIVTMAVIILASALLILVPPTAGIIFAAVLLGLGVGADLPVSLAAISESARAGLRERLLVLTNLLWVAGIAVNLVLVSIVGDRGLDAIHTIFLHIATAAAVVLLARTTIPESRLWRLAQRERLAGVGTVRGRRSHVRELLRTPYRVPFAGLLVFYSLTNLIANTNGQFGPYVLVNFGGLGIADASRVLLVSIPVVVIGLFWFIRIARRGVVMSYFRFGAVCAVASPLILTVYGVSAGSYVVALVLGAVGNVFAFEAVMKIWTQQSFPTLLRATAQGAVIGVARLAAAGFAAVTPLLLLVGTSVLYGILAWVGAVGMITAEIVFRRRSGTSEFERESALDVID